MAKEFPKGNNKKDFIEFLEKNKIEFWCSICNTENPRKCQCWTDIQRWEQVELWQGEERRKKK